MNKFLVSYVVQYGGNPMFHSQIIKAPVFNEQEFHKFRETYSKTHGTQVTILAVSPIYTT